MTMGELVKVEEALRFILYMQFDKRNNQKVYLSESVIHH